MKRSMKELFGFSIQATDHELGSLHDVFIDDDLWRVRYFVVSTGGLLGGKKVLLSPAVVTGVDWENEKLLVGLTRDQVKHAPNVDLAEPISHGVEQQLADYYRWPLERGSQTGAVKEEPARRTENYMLSSGRELMKYHLRTLEDKAGGIKDILYDDATWSVSYLVTDTGGVISGKKVLVSPEWILRVDMPDSEVDVRLHQQAVEDAPTFDPAQPLSPEIENRYTDYWSARG